MKALLVSIVLIVIVGIGGFFYRSALERPVQPVACPLGTKSCPDGTIVYRAGLSCVFPVCPPPNVSLPDIGISFALPPGFSQAESSVNAVIMVYDSITPSSDGMPGRIAISRYMIAASSTALATIQETAINSTSGLPVGATLYTSTILGTHRFTVVQIERFEGVIGTAYYLARQNDVLRFDAIDRDADWTNLDLDPSTLYAHRALKNLLVSLQME